MGIDKFVWNEFGRASHARKGDKSAGKLICTTEGCPKGEEYGLFRVQTMDGFRQPTLINNLVRFTGKAVFITERQNTHTA